MVSIQRFMQSSIDPGTQQDTWEEWNYQLRDLDSSDQGGDYTYGGDAAL